MIFSSETLRIQHTVRENTRFCRHLENFRIAIEIPDYVHGFRAERKRSNWTRDEGMQNAHSMYAFCTISSRRLHIYDNNMCP